jgi:DNA ligase-1
VGYFLGKGARARFKFGGLLCAVYDEKDDAFKSITKIGTGFSEDQMKQLEEMLGKIKVDHKLARVDSEIKPDFWVDLKYVVAVAADEITRSPTHTAGKTREESGYALRFPRMVSLREDKSPEEATTVQEIIEMYKMQKRIQLEEV